MAWAEFHHETVMLPVKIGWAGDRPGADWIYPVIADCVIRAVLRLPGVVGVETGYGVNGWATGIYSPGTPTKVETLVWLGDLVVTELEASPFSLDQDGPVRAELIDDSEYTLLQSLSNYAAQQVGWSSDERWRID